MSQQGVADKPLGYWCWPIEEGRCSCQLKLTLSVDVLCNAGNMPSLQSYQDAHKSLQRTLLNF